MIKLVVFDLDGTLAKMGETIEKSDVEKLKKLEDMGIRIAISSGKTVDYLAGFMRQVGLKYPILFGENGGMIQIGVEWPPREAYILPYPKQVKETLAMLKNEIQERLPNLWYQPNQIGVSPFPKCEDDFEVIAELLKEKEALLEDINVYRHVDCFDLIPKGIDKKAGLRFLAHKMDFTREGIVAVGDGENDYPMFQFAGLSLGINVKDTNQVNKNFNKVSDALDYLCQLCEEERMPGKPESDDWYTQALEDMEDFIESQGIYLRQ